jgi:hypothetical protein
MAKIGPRTKCISERVRSPLSRSTRRLTRDNRRGNDSQNSDTEEQTSKVGLSVQYLQRMGFDGQEASRSRNAAFLLLIPYVQQCEF